MKEDVQLSAGMNNYRVATEDSISNLPWFGSALAWQRQL